MSSSRHPIALSVEQTLGGPTGLLAVVMCLPLVDGIFPALVLAGALDNPVGIVEVGLLIFGGSATVAVIIAEMDDSPRKQAKRVLGVGAILITGAAIEAALAPTIASGLNLVVFERFAGVVILAVAARTVSARVGEYLPGPGVIVALGLVASIDPAGFAVAVNADPGLVLRAIAAAGVGTAFALGVAVASPWLRNAVDIDRFRFGSAVALGVLPLSIYGLIPSEAPLALAVLVVTAVLAFDPSRATEAEWEYRPDEIDITAAMADGSGVVDVDPDPEPESQDRPAESDDEDDSFIQERAPWL
ncbi:DUF5794 domain-containing protein [Halobacteriales archaeon Cl-PHB]